MNRVTLLLNTVILVVTFLLALSATDTQIGLMQSSVATHVVRPSTFQDRSVAFLKVVQSLDPRDKLDRAKLEAVHAAVERYYQVVRYGVTRSRYEEEDDLVAAYADVGKQAREEVERALASGFRSDAAIRRVATQIIRVCL